MEKSIFVGFTDSGQLADVSTLGNGQKKPKRLLDSDAQKYGRGMQVDEFKKFKAVVQYGNVPRLY